MNDLLEAIPMPEPFLHATAYFDYKSRRRALELLWSHLSDAQKSRYVATECHEFDAIGNESGATYTIRRGLVYREFRGKGSHWCLDVGLSNPVPYEDILLAKKILIERAEHLFIATAILQ